MNNLKIDRARLIEELRKTSDPKIQEEIKVCIDECENLMYTKSIINLTNNDE